MTNDRISELQNLFIELELAYPWGSEGRKLALRLIQELLNEITKGGEG